MFMRKMLAMAAILGAFGTTACGPANEPEPVTEATSTTTTTTTTPDVPTVDTSSLNTTGEEPCGAGTGVTCP